MRHIHLTHDAHTGDTVSAFQIADIVCNAVRHHSTAAIWSKRQTDILLFRRNSLVLFQRHNVG